MNRAMSVIDGKQYYLNANPTSFRIRREELRLRALTNLYTTKIMSLYVCLYDQNRPPKIVGLGRFLASPVFHPGKSCAKIKSIG